MLHSVRKKFLTFVSPLSFVRVASAGQSPHTHFAYGDDFQIPTYPSDTTNSTASPAPSAANPGDNGSETVTQPPQKPRGGSSGIMSLFWYAVIALGFALVVRLFIAAPYLVQGASMDPTFETWHYLVIDRISYELSAPERGDVVVFRFPQDESRSFIKRIIGLPGETVILSGTNVSIVNAAHPEGLTLAEPYVAAEHTSPTTMSVTLGDDEYFVMGDNRAESADSRYWGALPRENIVGRAFMRIFPLNELSLFPGEARYTSETNEQ